MAREKLIRCESCGRMYPKNQIKAHQKDEPKICKYC